MHMVPVELYVSHIMGALNPDKTVSDFIKDAIFDYWRSRMLQSQMHLDKVHPDMKWLLDINKIVMIECDLLAPKSTVEPAPEECSWGAPEWLKVRLPNRENGTVDELGWITKDQWDTIQEVLAGRGPSDVHQFNVQVDDAGADMQHGNNSYYRCVVCRPQQDRTVFGTKIELV